MNRSAALTYLTALYGASTSPYLTLTGIALTDTDDGLKAVIDDALLAVGTAYADLATAQPSDTRQYRAALRFYALDFAWQNLNSTKLLDKAKAGDVEVASVEWRKHLKAARDDAAAVAQSLGVDVLAANGATGWAALGDTVGVPGWSLDYLEPVELTS
jgi:hypothetical protein